MQMESQVLQVNIDDIIPNRFQPRIAFDDQGIKELASSIKEHGIIQPLVLRKLGKKYEIIAGERRYKAATLAGLTQVPAVISNIDDNKSAEIALVENIQRRDLTPIEEARSYKNLLDKGYLTQEDLAKKMGLSQPAIANKLRLLNLDETVQQALLDGKISERHARSLLTLNNKEDQKIWLDKILSERLTVRQLDQELKNLNKKESVDEPVIPLVDLNPDLNAIKNNATDINPTKSNDVASMMVPENAMTEYSDSLPLDNISELQNNSPVVEEQPVTSSKEPINKFFNQLESEPVNMNANNSFSVDSVFDSNPTTNNQDVEIFDIPSNNTIDSPVSEPTTIDNSVVSNSKPIPELNPNNKFFQSINTTEEESLFSDKENDEVINPMNYVETLDDNFNIKQAEAEGTDLNSVISEIRNLINSLQDRGINIKKEEADLADSYQINIKLDKNNY